MREVYLVTTNEWKIEVARRVVEERYGIIVTPKDLDVPEVQHDDPKVIARASAEEACRLLGAPVIKSDSGLWVHGLNGFPGPYTGYVKHTLGIDGLLRLCAGLEDQRAAIYSVVAFCDGGTQPRIFYGETTGKLLREKRGEHGYFFDFIFVPEGCTKTLAEFDAEEQWPFWGGAYEKFAKWYVTRSR